MKKSLVLATLFAAVALLSAVAPARVGLRERSRQQPEVPAEMAGLSASYLRVLRSQRPRPLVTARDVFYALAGLGGHLGRTGDGPPGWQTLWLGLLSLRQLVAGVRLAANLTLDEDEKKRRPAGRRFLARCG